MKASADVPLNRNASFLKLWGGQSVALLGSKVSQLALPLVAIYTLDASPSMVGLIGTATFLPYLLFALWAGAWIDRRRRLPIMITTDVVRGVVLLGILGLAVTGTLTMWIMLGLVFVFSTCSVLFELCYYSFVPSIVPSRDLVAANSRLQASDSVAEVGGPGLGGVLVQLLTAPFALVAQMISFVVSAVTLASIRDREPQPEPPAGGAPPIMAQIRQGLVTVVRAPLLRTLVVSAALYNFFANWVMALFPVFAVRALDLNAATIGLIRSCGAIGGVLGAVAAGRLIARLGIGSSYLASIVLPFVAFVVIAVTPANTAFTVVVLTLAFAASGFLVVSNVVAISVRQTITPTDLLGRMNATYKFISYGVIALGTFAGGVVGDLLSLRAGMIIGAVGLVLNVLWILASPLRPMRELPEPVDETPASGPEPEADREAPPSREVVGDAPASRG